MLLNSALKRTLDDDAEDNFDCYFCDLWLHLLSLRGHQNKWLVQPVHELGCLIL